MAIADAEPKKGEVDVTSTGSSTGVKDMKRPSQGLVKYSTLKDFSFSVSDVWDDNNIKIFLECCHAYFTDFQNFNCSEENKVWEKIAKTGLERGGSISCFNVNYCLELAKCLKSFVSKNETKMMDNAIFKTLCNNVVDLLPYWAPVSATLTRNRSESQEKSRMESNHFHSGDDHYDIIMRPFKSPSDSTQALKKISQILGQYDIEELMKTSTRSALWKQVSALVENEFGLKVNPKEFLEGYKSSVIATVRTYSSQDPKLKADVFLKSVGDMLPYFDLIAPKNVKKSDFLGLAEEVSKEVIVSKPEARKRRHDAGEEENAEPSLKSSAKMSNSSPLSNPEPVLNRVNPATPLRTYSKKKHNLEAEAKLKKPRSESSSEDDSSRPFDFMGECAVSTVENATETVSEHPETSARTEPVAKKRGRKPRARAESSSTKLVENTKAIAPSRHVTRSKRSDSLSSITLNKAVRKPSPSRSAPCAPLVEDDLSTRTSPSTSSAGIERLSESSSHKDDVSPKESGPGLGLIDDTADSDDSEVEDVPLVGTNVTYARHDVRKAKPLSKNMQPVVILKKMAAEELLLASEGKPAVKRTRGGRPRKMPLRLDPSGVQHHDTAIVRRRPGRPPKNPAASLAKAPTRPNVSSRPAVIYPPTSTSLMRNQPMHIPNPANTGYFSRDLTPRVSSPLSVYSTSVLRSDDYITQPNPEMESAPEWFQRFVVEARRQEMWKMHQFLKMQQELLEEESKKRGVLDKILSALSVRYERS